MHVEGALRQLICHTPRAIEGSCTYLHGKFASLPFTKLKRVDWPQPQHPDLSPIIQVLKGIIGTQEKTKQRAVFHHFLSIESYGYMNRTQPVLALNRNPFALAQSGLDV